MRNYNNRSKGSNNNRDKSEDLAMKGTPSVSPINSAIKMGTDEIYAVSSLHVTTGGTADFFQFRAKDIPLQQSAILDDTTNMNSLLEAPISELIRAYATARGYTTGVDYAKVSTYVWNSLEAFSILLHMFRAQNVRQLKTDSGIDVGFVLGNRPSVSSVTFVPQYVINGVLPNPAYVDDGAVNINNTTWSRDWLSPLTHFKLSEPLVKWAISMFSVFYRVSTDGVSTHLTFVPSLLTTSSGVAAYSRYSTLVSALQTARQTDADLVDILNFLGFTNEGVISIDFTRDARQLTMPVIDDEFIQYMYVNSNLEGLADQDSDVANHFYDINGSFSALNYVDDAQLSADLVFAAKYLGDGALPHNVYKTAYSGGQSLAEPYYPFPLNINVGTYPATQAIMDRLIGVGKYHGTSGLPQIPYIPEAIIQDLLGSPTIAQSSLVLAFVAEGANTYVLPETFDFYKLVKRAEIIMDNTEYRSKLQGLSNQIRTSSITKQS